MELLGVVGEYAAELRVYQLHFGVKPCRYPSEEAWALRPADAEAGGRLDCTHLRVFSVDNAGHPLEVGSVEVSWKLDARRPPVVSFNFQVAS